MQRVRDAELDEVLAATPRDEPSRKVTRERGPYAVWKVGLVDIQRIVGQLPKESGPELGVVLDQTGQGTVADLFPFWTCWIHSGRPEAEVELAKHKYFVSAIQEYGRFSVLPILLGPRKEIHDGKHRLFAAYELLLAHESPRRENAPTWDLKALHLEVFWNGEEH